MYFQQRPGRYYLMGVVIAVWLCTPGRSGAQKADVDFLPAQDLPAILARLGQAWSMAREAILSGDMDRARGLLDQVLEAKWDAGIRDLPAHSAALLKLAHGLKEQKQDALDDELFQFSQELAPSHFGAGLAQARYFLGENNFSPIHSIQQYLAVAFHLTDDFEGAKHLLAFLGWSGLLALFIALVCFGLIILARYLRLFIHDIRDIFPPRFLSNWMMIALPLAFLFIPLFFGAPYWVLTLFWILLFSIYMKKGERIIASILILAFLAVPLCFNLYTAALGACENQKLTALLRIRNGIYSDEDIETIHQAQAQESLDQASLLSLALVNRKKGRFQEAAKYYSEARKLSSYQDVTYNNLGNLYLAVGQTEDAIKAYKKAVSLNPKRVEPVYNLSHAYYEIRDFEKQEQFYHQAERIAELRMKELDKMAYQYITRTIVDIPVPVGLLVKVMRASTPRLEEIRKAVWDNSFGFLNPKIFPLLSILGLLILGLASWGSRGLSLSYACSICGQPICQRCNPPSRNPDLCSPCYSAFYTSGGLDPKMRMQKKMSAQRYRAWTRNIGWISTIFLPGTGHLLNGRSGKGIPFLAVSCLILGFVFSPRWLWSLTAPGEILVVSPAFILKSGAYLVLMFAALLHYHISTREEV
jgi:tetratricopeptide (TPR) repeat protein